MSGNEINIFSDIENDGGGDQYLMEYERKRIEGEALTLELFDQEEEGTAKREVTKLSPLHTTKPSRNEQQLYDRIKKLEKDQKESSKKIYNILLRLDDTNHRYGVLYDKFNQLEMEQIKAHQSLSTRTIHNDEGLFENIMNDKNKNNTNTSTNSNDSASIFASDNHNNSNSNSNSHNHMNKSAGTNLNGQEDDAPVGRMRSLSQDTYTLMKTNAICTSTWIFSYIVNCIQQLLIFLIFFEQSSKSVIGTPFGVNYKSDPYSSTASFIAIMVALAISRDLFNPIIIELPNLWLTNTEQWLKVTNASQQTNASPDCWTWMLRIFLPNIMQFATGTMAFLVSFIIIIQGDNIVMIFAELVALGLIAEMDNIAFWCAKSGYIGDRAMADSINAKKVEVEDISKKFCCSCIQLRPLVFLSLLLIMVGSLIPVITRQANGVYFRMIYPKCNVQHAYQILQINDGRCDRFANTYECGFDGGDCVHFNIAYPSCYAENPESVGDGVCESKYNTSDCGFDGGDCCVADDKLLGDGKCHASFNNPLCLYDYGDCNDLRQAYPSCPVYGIDLKDDNGQPIILGNGQCNQGKKNITAYMNEACGYVFGDCKDVGTKDIEMRAKYPHCSGVTDFFRIGDGVCDAGAYLTEQCGFDEYDCCELDQELIGDGICDSGDQKTWRSLDGPYLNEECGYEAYDCCPSFAKLLVANGVCADEFQLIENGPFEKVSFNSACGWDGDDCTVAGYPKCSVADPRLIGDKVCHGGDYNSEECGYDGGDCEEFNREFPNCQVDNPFMLGDGKCDDMAGKGANTVDCGYDNLDCLIFNARYPECAVRSPYKVGDGYCNPEHNNEECGSDGGDCISNKSQFKSEFELNYPSCDVSDPSELNNGVCNAKGPNGDFFNSRSCGYDGGDCVSFALVYPGCNVDNPSKVGDGRCDRALNTLECNFDGGDCIEFDSKYPNCRVSDPERLGNKLCDGGDYNTEKCGFDDGDCEEFNKAYPNCDAEFPIEIGDGLCQGKYNTASCRFDGGDCEEFKEEYPNCMAYDLSLIGNGICDNYFPYNTRQCGYDGFDCKDFNELYPACDAKYHTIIGDGHCDNYEPYNTVDCSYDGGDCADFYNLYPLCKARDTDEIGDGKCDGIHNIVECNFDGGDCDDFNKLYPYCFVFDPSAIGDGKCNKSPSYNNELCGFDGGDCSLHLSYPDCEISLINNLEDGICHGSTNTPECKYDGGDCDDFNLNYPLCIVEYPTAIGDGFCHGPYNTLECEFDGGDCNEFNRLYPNCIIDTPSNIGDGHCNISFNTSLCGHDGGDCL